MAINKINRVVLHEDVKEELDNKATKQELQSTKEELENAMNETYQGIVWKPTVPTFDDLRIKYPDAKDGWTANVEDTNITYQYDLETNTWFPTSINALPLATSKVDGLMAKEDKIKLDTVEPGAQKNLTPMQMLEQIKTVDGKGSGLDSDLFQGRKPESFANKDHEHDGLYYKKLEVNSFLNDKAPKNHVHSKEQITDFKHNHSPDEIVENENKRFVSDAEKSNWNDANSKKHIHNNKTVLDKITQGLFDTWNTVANKVDKVEGQGLSDENYTLVEKNKLKDIITGATKNDTDANLKNRANHTGTQLPSTISNFADTVRSTVLTGLSTATNTVITATDTILSALGKLQKQITDNLSALTSHIGNKSNPHGVTKSQIDLDNVQNYGIATQSEAETGTSNAKYVTPLRVKQAIDKFKIKKVSELENDKNYVTSDELGNAGYGDMMRSTYDKNGDGIVDRTKVADSVPWSGITERPSTFTPSEHTHNDKANVIATYNSGEDPNTTTNQLLLTMHSNCPESGYWYIVTLFYSSLDSSRFQIAYKYNGNPRIYFRLKYFGDNDWKPWAKIWDSNSFDPNTKVDKVSGKQLSAEDYTTTEKTKLANIEYGANNYKHPATHPVDMIVGLHPIAKNGNYNELNGKPIKLSQFENDIKPYHKGGSPPANTNLFWLDTNI